MGRFVDKTNWLYFRKCWKEIDLSFPHSFDPQAGPVIAELRRRAREALKSEMRVAFNLGPESYLIPV